MTELTEGEPRNLKEKKDTSITAPQTQRWPRMLGWNSHSAIYKLGDLGFKLSKPLLLLLQLGAAIVPILKPV